MTMPLRLLLEKCQNTAWKAGHERIVQTVLALADEFSHLKSLHVAERLHTHSTAVIVKVIGLWS